MPLRAARLIGLVAALCMAPPAWGLIDPDRPVSWLVGECRTIAALKVTAAADRSATFAVVKVLKGDFKPATITIRWTATQKPPVEKAAVGSPAVLLIPKDPEDPTLVQVSPEYLSLTPAGKRPGEYDFLRLNGFVKGSFNGEAEDLIRLIADTLAKRAYFPIWADTAFAAARKIGDLPDAARALAIGDVDGDGRLDVLVATAKGAIALSPAAARGFSSRAIEDIGAASILQLADADCDRRMDMLTDGGLFLSKGSWRFAPAARLAGRKWSAACFGYVGGRAAPAIAAVEAGRARILARGAHGAWADVSSLMGLEEVPVKPRAISLCDVGDRLAVVLVTADALLCLEAPPGKPLKQVQSVPLAAAGQPGPMNLHVIQRDLDGDGVADVFLAFDGAATFLRRRPDGRLAEVPDYLGDVRNMFQGVEGCAGLICEDFNNDGLADMLAWSKSGGMLLVMNRGYHNLRDATALFDLPPALKGLGETQAVAAGDIDGDGDLDLLVASGRGIYLLSNTFEKKPEEANDRPRNRLLTVCAPGRFGALVTLLDNRSRPLARGRIGAGPVAETLYIGYRAPAPAAVTLETTDGKSLRQEVAPDSVGKPVVFK